MNLAHEEPSGVTTPSSPRLPRDVLVIVVGLLCSLVVAPSVGGICQHYVVAGPLFAPTDDSVDPVRDVQRLRAATYVLGRVPFDLLCGVLLGKYLRRLRPWYVFAAVSGFYVTAHGAIFSYRVCYDPRIFHVVGTFAGTLISVGVLAEIVGMIAVGVACGRAQPAPRRGVPTQAHGEG